MRAAHMIMGGNQAVPRSSVPAAKPEKKFTLSAAILPYTAEGCIRGERIAAAQQCLCQYGLRMTFAANSLAVSAAPPEIVPVDQVENPDLRALLAYWERLRGPDAMPRQPRATKDIAHLLKHVHFSDVIDHGADFRFHLIGDAAFRGLCENQTGKLVSEHPDIGVRLRLPILMREVVRTKKPVVGLAIRVTGNANLRADSVWLPFGGPDVTQIMGMTALTLLGPTDISNL